MSKRFIIAIGREFGSGGKHIGRALAKELGVNLYDRNIVEKVAEELAVETEHLMKYAKKKSIAVKQRFFYLMSFMASYIFLSRVSG